MLIPLPLSPILTPSICVLPLFKSLLLHGGQQVTVHAQRDSNIAVPQQLLNHFDIHPILRSIVAALCLRS